MNEIASKVGGKERTETRTSAAPSPRVSDSDAPESLEELLRRARHAYLRTLDSPDSWTVPAELAATLSLVPALCRELERLRDGRADRPPSETTGNDPGGADSREALLRLIGHELRNRLNSPRLHARLLEKKLTAEDSEEGVRLARLLTSGIEAAATVVDDVSFLLSHPTGSGATVRALILELAERYSDRAAEAGIALELIEPLTTARVAGRGLHLALENLMLNAIQHHSGGDGAWVRLSTHRERGEVEIRVEDNGPGIPEGAEPDLRGPALPDRHLPDRDLESEAASEGDHDRLGLVIVARAVRAMGGRLEFHTLPGGTGTRVVLHLPEAEP